MDETTGNLKLPKRAVAGAAAFAKLEEMYDGFRFHPNAERVFNPVSVGKCLTPQEFGSCWFGTGTPAFLIDLLKRDPLEAGEVSVTTSELSSSYEPERVSMRTSQMTCR